MRLVQLPLPCPVSVVMMRDVAINRVRPLFAALGGVSAPWPRSGSARNAALRLDPDELRRYNVSPKQAFEASPRGSTVMPAGNTRVGGQPVCHGHRHPALFFRRGARGRLRPIRMTAAAMPAIP